MVVAPGTVGQADKCAPSATNGELGGGQISQVQPLLEQGFRVVVSDYIGLGAPGVHTYANRLDQGQTFLDAARRVGHRRPARGFPGCLLGLLAGRRGHGDGRSLSAHFDDHPEIASLLDQHRIGRLKPNAPVLALNGRNDDVIPFQQAERMARDWCSLGADVTFVPAEIPRIAPGLGIERTAPVMSGSELATHYMAAAFGIALKTASQSGSVGDVDRPASCQF
ncbi:alpha/beta hydrolase [Corynebacterium xerosis]